MQNTYVGLNNDHHGITQLGRIVLDGRVFGFIPETEDCAGWDLGRMQLLMDKVQVEWDKYAGLPSRLPPDLQKIVAGAINDAGLKQREDIKKLNETVQADLVAKGLQFNAPKSDSFRAALREAGFYADWKKRFGDEAWGLLEQAVGKLA